ncbi:MAG: DUF4198 domain-containing protein [Gemmatimonadaceae bacterium]
MREPGIGSRESGARGHRRLACRLLGAVLLVATAGSLLAHDLFLKPDDFFPAPGAEVTVRVLNGTFSLSENSVTKDRVRDISLVGPSGASRLDTTVWSDRGDTSVLAVRTGAEGTYVIGASILPRALRLEAKEFNDYLASDGVPDVLAARRRDGELNFPARERYSKHVKAVVQAGSARTSGFDHVLGYPAELVPLDNPYSLRPGASLRVRALVDGAPVAGQLVISGGRTPRGGRIAQRSARTDADGVVRVRVGSPGAWYVKFIHMARVTADTSIDYESKWATLTFGVRQ